MTDNHSPAAEPLDSAPVAMPPTADESFQKLPHAALQSARIGTLLRAVLLGGGLSLVTSLILGAELDLGVGPGILIVLAGIAFWAGLGWIWQSAAHRRIGYRIDADGWHIRRGVFWRTETLVPRSRVQHVDVNHGPIDRYFGLATLKVHTAGTRMQAVSLHGLLADDAVSLRDALLSHDDDAV